MIAQSSDFLSNECQALTKSKSVSQNEGALPDLKPPNVGALLRKVTAPVPQLEPFLLLITKGAGKRTHFGVQGVSFAVVRLTANSIRLMLHIAFECY